MIASEYDLSAFGELLKMFRKRRRLTQQQLASAIGVHRNAISRWERGDFLPGSKTIIFELARHLRLNNQETRALLDASLTAPAPYWYVPLLRNPFFTGREEILEILHMHLATDQVIALTQSYALQGLGGIGKTQVALEYAYRYTLEYRAVFWIGAETVESILASLLHIAETLQLPGRENKDHQRTIAAVQHWLSTHDQWLLIWDNVEDLTVLDRFLPFTRSGTILITTRCQVLGTFAQGLNLLPMEQKEGIVFLLRRAKLLDLASEVADEQVRQFAARSPEHYAAAADLVAILGGLPLALDQAGAYLEATQCGLLAYLDLFRTRRTALLQQRGSRAHQHPESVSTTFALAITAAAQSHPAVWDLLRVCALLQPDAIPEELFRQGSEHLGAQLQAVGRDALEWDKVVAAACAHSLLSRQPEERTLSLHRLVQAVLLDAMTEAEREQWSRRAVRMLDAVFPEILPATEYATWKQGKRLLPHTRLWLQQDGNTDEALALASLAYKVAQYLRARGPSAEAEPLFQRALQIREQILGSDHPDVASSLHYLALLYYQRGQYAQAEPLYRRALQIREHALGLEHPDVARVLNNLAALCWSRGQYAQAEPLYRRALQIWEQTHRSDHPDVASPLNNLALLRRDQGKYEQAEPLWQRALSIWEQALGPDHPLVAQALNNLALLYYQQGRNTEAEPLYLRALHLLEYALGSDHPEMVQTLNNLANLYRDQGKGTEAESLFQHALQISERSQRADHPDVAVSLTGLANISLDQGNDAEAEQLFQRALRIQEQHLGQHHPKMADTLHDLSILRQKQGNLSKALSLAERALAIRLQSLGDAHPKTIASRTLIAQLGAAQGAVLNGATCTHHAEDRFRPSRST